MPKLSCFLGQTMVCDAGNFETDVIATHGNLRMRWRATALLRSAWILTWCAAIVRAWPARLLATTWKTNKTIVLKTNKWLFCFRIRRSSLALNYASKTAICNFTKIKFRKRFASSANKESGLKTPASICLAQTDNYNKIKKTRLFCFRCELVSDFGDDTEFVCWRRFDFSMSARTRFPISVSV